MMNLVVSDIRQTVRELYRTAPFGQRLLCLGRPLICPSDVLIEQVPEGSSMLDLGCGSGHLLNLLAHARRISHGIGYDSSSKAIRIARAAASEQLPGSPNIQFECRSFEMGMPEGRFDVVSMIDVIHHIEPAAQRRAIVSAVSRGAPNGLFLFKDIGVRPRWRAWANRLHDLVLARQWINYVSADRVIEWLSIEGFDVAHRETISMLWYAHELIVFHKAQTDRDDTL